MNSLRLSLFALWLLLNAASRAALPSFDFTTAGSAEQWGSPHDVTLTTGPEGLLAHITGSDPYFSGPPRDYPLHEQLWMSIELDSSTAGMAQLFFFDEGPREEKSVRFFVPAGRPANVRVPLPPLGRKARLRFDPPGTSGTCLLRKIAFAPRPKLEAPAWAPATPLDLPTDSLVLSAGSLVLRHHPSHYGAFEIFVDSQQTASGHRRLPVGISVDGRAIWFELTNAATVHLAGKEIRSILEFNDSTGVHWALEQSFRSADDAIAVESRVTVSSDREVVFLPLVALFPGVGSFGTNKSQALLAGVEYLENEPSSSEADVIGSGALRRVPDGRKITFPLEAISAGDHYLALSWEKKAQVAAIFDSPDRVFGSSGHLFGLIFPGSAPEIRADGDVLPYAGVKLKAGQTLTTKALIWGGRGATIVPAVQDYVKRARFPEPPEPGYTKIDYFRLAAHGWLDSRIRDGEKFRHAVGPTFNGNPSADAALYMQWLSQQVDDPQLTRQLTNVATAALALVPPGQYNSLLVGHIQTAAQALAFGSVFENARTAEHEARSLLPRFREDGSYPFLKPAEGNDLGRTHWSREANGLAATHVSSLLDRALFSGDRELQREALRLVRALSKFRDTVPRGAQTWEVPLHTPDILASAYLVHAFTLAFELTGETDLLDQARYWAWTGVPFLYLTPPTDQRVGLYATVPVLGATQWVAPLWIGLPVQWCGLVYAHAIRRLGRFDSSAPWSKIANGIAFSGVQQTHPNIEPESQGLLPDSFDLATQSRNPVPINPATLLPEAIAAYGEPALDDFHYFQTRGITLHAPGPIRKIRESADAITFTVEPWQPGWMLLQGLEKRPSIQVNGHPLDLNTASFEDHKVMLKLQTTSEVTLRFD